MEKIIKYGQPLFDVITCKDITHHINNVRFNDDTVSVIIQKGLVVEEFKISVFEAQRIGFINFNALEKYCK